MGRGRKGLIEQSQRKPKRADAFTPRGKPIIEFWQKNRKMEEMTVPEHVVVSLKKMKPQQIVDFLLSKDD